MNAYQQSYYCQMLVKDRLIPITQEDSLVGFITYYIGSDVDTYVRDDPWSVLEDNPDGEICFIDQAIMNHEKKYTEFSHSVWSEIKRIIKEKHPSVNLIRWNRFKGGKVHVYQKAVKQKKHAVCSPGEEAVNMEIYPYLT